MIGKLRSFVKNGGRLRAGEEPKFGEPFYGEYMEQFLSMHFKPGDKIRLQEKIYDNESKTYEGIIIALGFRLELLVSGRKVHKGKRNKKEINYVFIETVEMIKTDDGNFDLAVVDPEKWEWNNNRDKNDIDFCHRKTEQRRNRREEDKKEFQQVYPGVDFDKSHVIKISGGCRMYWPFEYESINAEIFMVRDDDKITAIPCETGTPFPNKKSLHVYNCKMKDRYPDLYLYLPDNGFIYEDVNVVCVWTINTIMSGKCTKIKVLDIYHIGEIKPIEDEHNMIFIDMSVTPLLGYGESLFSDCKKMCFLSGIMEHDIYSILNTNEDTAFLVKVPEESEKDEVDKYLLMANLAVSSFDLQKAVERIVSEYEEYVPHIEVFCKIDTEPERYYSSSWRNIRKKYQFKLLDSK